MRLKKYNQSGFGATGILIIVAVIIVAALAGLYVYHRNHKPQPASQVSVGTSPSASKIANTLSSQKTDGSTSSTSNTNVITTPVQNVGGKGGGSGTIQTNNTFTSKYTGLQFTYPTTWSSKTWENDSSGGAITLTSGDGNVLLSYGSPVVKPTNSCSASSTKIHIYDVESGPTLSNTKSLYVVSFNNGTYNSVALTDWDGQTPAVGDTDKCSSYQPAFVNTSTGAYSWFDISDLSDSYRALDYSTFAAKADVKDAISIIQSAKQ